jgi:hypothetical protein
MDFDAPFDTEDMDDAIPSDVFSGFGLSRFGISPFGKELPPPRLRLSLTCTIGKAISFTDTTNPNVSLITQLLKSISLGCYMLINASTTNALSKAVTLDCGIEP